MLTPQRMGRNVPRLKAGENPIKIIYLHQYFNTPDMTGSTRSYEMARRLVQFGHEVHMITSDRRETGAGLNGWHTTENEGINVHWLPVPYSNKMDYRERIKAFFKFAWSAGSKAIQLGGDVVFATSTPLTIALPAVRAARKNRLPMVLEVRDLWPEVPIALGALKNPAAVTAAGWLERFAYRNSNRVIALSPGMKEGIVTSGYPADRVAVIPNSCDLDFFGVGPGPGLRLRERHHWLQRRPLVIYTGTIGLVNGVSYLAHLAAVTQKLNPEICFLIIGSGREENIVRNTAEKLGIWGQNFFMLPSVPKREMPAWLSAADLATSVVIDVKALWANSANKFFDTLAAGKPVAINHEGWQAEIIRATGCGLVLNIHDLETSARELSRAVLNKEWLNNAGRAAHRLAENRFSRSYLAQELERVLLDAVYNPEETLSPKAYSRRRPVSSPGAVRTAKEQAGNE